MKAKGRRYLILLGISVAVRIFFYFFRFEATSFEPIAKSQILYDVIFFSIQISLLSSLKERKWLIGLAWLALFASIAYCVLEFIGDDSSILTRQQYVRCMIIVGLTFIGFYSCLFFARKSPARIFLRLITATTILPYFYGLFAFLFHLPDPAALFSSPTTILLLSVLDNILLALAVWRTRDLHQPQYADFLQ